MVALEAYLDAVKGSNEARPRTVLEQAGFIACANGEPNFSRDYKRALRDSLSSKTRSSLTQAFGSRSLTRKIDFTARPRTRSTALASR